MYACTMYVCMGMYDVCIYVCMYVYMYACMYICMHVCIYVCMYVCYIYCPLQHVNQYIHPHRKHTCCYFFMYLSFIRDIPFSQHSFYIIQSKFMQPFYVHAKTKTIKCQICFICF